MNYFTFSENSEGLSIHLKHWSRMPNSSLRPRGSEIDRHYYTRGYYLKHIDRLDKKDRFTRVKVSRVLSLLKPRQGERIVDIGSGVGTMMVMLAPSGASMIGMDYSFESLLLTKANFLKNCPRLTFRGICGDGRGIALENDSVDAVMAADFTEHLDDETLRPTVREVFRILKKGGRFVIYTPCKTHIFERLKKHNIILKRDESHIGMRTMAAYCALLKESGFIIKEAKFAPTDIPLFNSVERLTMHVPFFGEFTRRRICICAVKQGRPASS